VGQCKSVLLFQQYGGVANMHEFITIFGKTSNYRIHHLVDEKKEFPFKDKTSGFEIRDLRSINPVPLQGGFS
jgi:adenine-specific DNA-methyltransferase